MVVAIVFTGVALAVLTAPLGPGPQPTQPRPGTGFFNIGPPQEGFRVGDLAPEFTGTTPTGETVQLADLNGNPIRLADLRGHPVWINFWATWCPPCQAETPILRDVYNEYADDGLALVAISVQETTADDVRAYVDRYGLAVHRGLRRHLGRLPHLSRLRAADAALPRRRRRHPKGGPGSDLPRGSRVDGPRPARASGFARASPAGSPTPTD